MKFRFKDEEKEYEVTYISKNKDGSITLFSKAYNEEIGGVIEGEDNIEVTEKDVITYSTDKVKLTKYYYFVSYACKDDIGNTTAYGYVTFDSSSKIVDEEDVKTITRNIQKADMDNFTILNINLLDVETDGIAIETSYKKYYYFLSYMRYTTGNKRYCENLSIEKTSKIKTFKDLASTIKNLKKDEHETIVFLSVNLLGATL